MHTERNAVCNLTPLEYVCGVAFSLVRLSLCLCCLPVHEGSETEACPSGRERFRLASRRNRRMFTRVTVRQVYQKVAQMTCSGHVQVICAWK